MTQRFRQSYAQWSRAWRCFLRQFQSPGGGAVAQLRQMARHRFPPPDLVLIVFGAPPLIVTAIPLKPAARIVRMNPPFRTPDCERLRGVDLEEIQLRIVPFRTEPRVLKPLGGEFRCTIRHVPAAEHPQPQHLFRRQLRLESGVEIPPRRFAKSCRIRSLTTTSRGFIGPGPESETPDSPPEIRDFGHIR